MYFKHKIAAYGIEYYFFFFKLTFIYLFFLNIKHLILVNI